MCEWLSGEGALGADDDKRCAATAQSALFHGASLSCMPPTLPPAEA